MARCYKQTDKEYKNYGGRGIEVCTEWREDKNAFFRWALANGWKPGLTIERVDVNGNYCPENCTFIPLSEQHNNKTDTLRITIDGVTRPAQEWCKIFGANKHTFQTRWNRGIRDPQKLFSVKSLRKQRPVSQYDKQGNLIADYASTWFAGKETGINYSTITNVCSKGTGTAGGYIWKYKGD